MATDSEDGIPMMLIDPPSIFDPLDVWQEFAAEMKEIDHPDAQKAYRDALAHIKEMTDQS